jgi:NADH dehydrogenase FAD-containing subunit
MATDAFNKVNGTENIYAIGDTCIQLTDGGFPNGHPQVAQVAIQQGLNLAKNFKLTRKDKALIPFKYNDKGSMAIIGKNKAVVDIPSPNYILMDSLLGLYGYPPYFTDNISQQSANFLQLDDFLLFTRSIA